MVKITIDDVLASGCDLGPLKESIKAYLEYSSNKNETSASDEPKATKEKEPIDEVAVEASLKKSFKTNFDAREELFEQASKCRCGTCTSPVKTGTTFMPLPEFKKQSDQTNHQYLYTIAHAILLVQEDILRGADATISASFVPVNLEDRSKEDLTMDDVKKEAYKTNNNFMKMMIRGFKFDDLLEGHGEK